MALHLDFARSPHTVPAPHTRWIERQLPSSFDAPLAGFVEYQA